MYQTLETPTVQKKGTVHKCPSCGAQLGAFVSACEACGHEFTDVDANRSITALVARFEEIEQEVDAKGIKGSNREKAIVEKRARVIRDFPVPNSREDLQQLMFFIQPKIVDSVKPDPNIEDWRSKFLEVLNRARHAYKNDSSALAEFERIEKSLTTSVKDSLQIKAKRNPLFAALAVGAVVLVVAGVVSSRVDQAKVATCEQEYAAGAQTEKARLERVAADADRDYQGKQYAQALSSAGNLRWSLPDASCKVAENQQARSMWDAKRVELAAMIQKAVDAEAAEKTAAAERVSAEKQAVENKVAEVARVAAEKEKAAETEKKW
ncbi:MAG: hypothetical protein ACXWC4_03590 [Telluria sp.]